MPESPSLSIAVLSDLHFFSKSRAGKRSDPSFLPVDAGAVSGASVNPLRALESLIDESGLRADLVLCGGDITDQVDLEGLSVGWDQLHSIKDRLRASQLIATTGNHDVFSRFPERAETFNAIEHLKRLRPYYPVNDRDKALKYWGAGYAISEGDNYRIVTLNSCYAHGTGRSEEYDRGRVAETVLDDLREDLGSLPLKPISILLCHHHPQQHAELQLGEGDVMYGGQRLLDLLARHGSWLVIHGHKHHAKITYAAGDCGSPVVFSAGSFGAFLSPQLATRTKNQFYMINVERPESLDSVVGAVRCWSWFVEAGWRPSVNGDHGLLDGSGFGYRLPVSLLASQIQAALPPHPLLWAELCERMPYLRYVLSSDLERVLERLSTHHNVGVTRDGQRVVEISRKT